MFVDPYIGLRQEWPAVEVEATGDHSILNREFLTSLGAHFHGDSIDILFLDSHIQVSLILNDLFFLKTSVD